MLLRAGATAVTEPLLPNAASTVLATTVGGATARTTASAASPPPSPDKERAWMSDRQPCPLASAHSASAALPAGRPHYPFPLRRGDRLAPELHCLLERQPVCPVTTNSGHRAWLVTGYALTRQALEDPHLSLVRTSRPHAPYQDFSQAPWWVTGFRDLTRQAGLLPELVRAMGPAHCEVTAAWLRTTADNLLADLKGHGPPADLWSDFAVPLASRTVCRLLGVPARNGPFLVDCVERDLILQDPGTAGRQPSEDGEGPVVRAAVNIDDWVREWMRHPETDPDGLLARLVRINDRRRRLSDRHFGSSLNVLIVGAVGNPMAFLGTACFLLLQHPALAESLRTDPEQVPRAVEELLRRSVLVGDGLARVARHPTTLGRVRVHRDDLVLLNPDTACYDPAVFPDPERFDMNRGPVPQPTFGYGRNRCPGSHLARLQARAALHALLPHLEHLRLAVPSDHVPWENRSAVLRPTALPVTW